MADLMYPGVPFFMNGKKYLIPSLKIRHFQDNHALLTSPIDVPEGSDAITEQYARYFPIILLAVQQNYPEVTLDNLYDWVVMDDFIKLFQIIQGVSGLEKVTPGE